MNTTMMRFALIAVVALTPIAGAVHAQTRAPTTLPGVAVVSNEIRVPYADLDTRTAAGLGDLKTRVNNAAVQVCRFHEGMLQEPLPEFECRYDAQAGAWEQFARHEARRGNASRADDQAQAGQGSDLARVGSLTR